MTLRSVLLGLIFGLFISTFTYFNDNVIRQTYLISNHLPAGVFGIFVVLLFLINPLLGRLRAVKPLGAKELAVVLALGLAVCGWPGSSFYRFFNAIVTMPPTMERTRTAWQATQTMSYVPSASPLLGEGHIRDWTAFSKLLVSQDTAHVKCPASRIWQLLPAPARDLAREVAGASQADPSTRSVLLRELNTLLGRSDFYSPEPFSSTNMPVSLLSTLRALDDRRERERQIANRRLLELSLPDYVLKQPRGKGFLLADGDLESPAVQHLLQGRGKRVGLGDIPWSAWVPTLITWGGLAVFIGIAAVCLMVILQPQWKRELLAYPIVRFVQEITEPSDKPGVAAVALNKLFWYGFVLMVAVHLINGLQAWFPNFIVIQRQFDFGALSQLFPNARQFSWGVFVIWNFTLYPTVIAFCFFLSAEVSFSVGISGLLWMGLFSILVANGIPMQYDWLDPRCATLLRFGSYLGAGIIIFLLGRRYYLRVIAATFGLLRDSETSANAVWAARVLVACFIAMVVILTRTGLDWMLSTLLMAMVLLLFVVMTRINAETGAFFVQPTWAAVGVLTALFGIRAIGPTAYIVMAMVCMVFTSDTRETVMPYVANSMCMLTDPAKKSPRTLSALLIAFVVVVGFVAATCATMYYQYNHGLNHWDTWAARAMPELPFARASAHISELSAYGELSRSLTVSGLGRFKEMSPDFAMLGWAFAGIVLVIVCGLLRLRLSWWPLHPVAFLVWGTFPGSMFAMSFLFGWAIKAAVVKFSGAKGYRVVKPFMVGVIAGELVTGLFWIAVGTIYYFATGLIPKSYRIY